MEDIFKILITVGIIVIGFVSQAKKEAKKKAGDAPAMPVPDEETLFPADGDDGTYGGYIPEGPRPEAVAARTRTEEKKHKPAPRQPFARPSSGNTSPEPPAEAPSEFEIRSAEEARKAIIWGEILQRKY